MSALRVSFLASAVTAASTYDRSALMPSARCGVPTQMKCTSPKSATSVISVVKRSRPAARLRRSSSGRPGSWNGTSPALNRAIFSASMSKPTTS
jgi:hypothetical protein